MKKLSYYEKRRLEEKIQNGFLFVLKCLIGIFIFAFIQADESTRNYPR